MSRRTRITISIVLAILSIIAISRLSADGRFRLHVFEIGVKHGMEDRQSGITYSTEAPGEKVFRNGAWSQDDKLLVQQMAAGIPVASKAEFSVFMAGYNFGYNALICCVLGAVVIGGLVSIVFFRVRGQHLKAI